MILKMKMMTIDDGDGIVIYYRTALRVHVCESMAPFINIRFGWFSQRWMAISGPKYLLISLEVVSNSWPHCIFSIHANVFWCVQNIERLWELSHWACLLQFECSCFRIVHTWFYGTLVHLRSSYIVTNVHGTW